jgi:hypothetical protein
MLLRRYAIVASLRMAVLGWLNFILLASITPFRMGLFRFNPTMSALVDCPSRRASGIILRTVLTSRFMIQIRSIAACPLNH